MSQPMNALLDDYEARIGSINAAIDAIQGKLDDPQQRKPFETDEYLVNEKIGYRNEKAQIREIAIQNLKSPAPQPHGVPLCVQWRLLVRRAHCDARCAAAVCPV